MDNFLLLIGGITFGFGAYLKYEHKQINPSKVTPKIAKEMIKLGAKVLDVRSKTELKLGKHPNAKNIITSELSEKKLTENNITKNDTIIVYCNTGTRARKASEKLIELGYKNSYYIVETFKSII